MKKYLIISAAAAICLLAACSKEKEPVALEEETIAEITHLPGWTYISALNGEDKGVKASVDNTTAAFTWSAGDKIAVYSGDRYYVSAPLASGGSNTAEFAFEGDINADRKFFAVFPASLVSNDCEASQNSLSLILPASYTLAQVQDDASPLPMIAVNTPDSGLEFKIICPILRITVKNIAWDAKCIKVTFPGKKVQGEFWLSNFTAGTDGVASEDAVDEGDDTITITDLGISDYTEQMVINIPVPMGTYNDVIVGAYDESGHVINYISVPAKKIDSVPTAWTPGRKSARKLTADLPVFTISEDKIVVFAPGNLQATLSEVVKSYSNGTQFWGASSWSFADNQYTAIGNTTANTLASPAENDVVDLFSWIGKDRNFTSGEKYGILKVISSSGTSSYVGNVKGDELLFDWGGSEIDSYAAGVWHTPSREEWEAVFTGSRSKTRCVKVVLTISDSPLTTLNGIIIMPDQYTHPLNYEFTELNRTASNFSANTVSLADWEKLEKAGCVFLPATGQRIYSSGNIIQEETSLWYWTTTADTGSGQALALYIKDGTLAPNKKSARYLGCAVRLVRDVKK